MPAQPASLPISHPREGTDHDLHALRLPADPGAAAVSSPPCLARRGPALSGPTLATARTATPRVPRRVWMFWLDTEGSGVHAVRTTS